MRPEATSVLVYAALRYLDSNAADEGDREALELVVLNELVEIYGEHLERYAHVRPENKVLRHVNHARSSVRVALLQLLRRIRQHTSKYVSIRQHA